MDFGLARRGRPIFGQFKASYWADLGGPVSEGRMFQTKREMEFL